MDQPASTSPVGIAAPLLRAGMTASLGILLLAVAFWDFRLAQEYDFLRIKVLSSEIVAGIAASICCGGGIHYLNQTLAGGPSWIVRFPLGVKTRLLMVLQLVAMGVALYAVGLMVLHEPIPGLDRSILYPGWEPPSTAE